MRTQKAVSSTSVPLGADAGAGDLEQTIWAIIAADFDGDTAIAPNGVAFFAEIKRVQWMERRR